MAVSSCRLSKAAHLNRTYHLGVLPHIPIEWHVLNEPHVDRAVAGHGDKIGDLVIIYPSHEDHIHLSEEHRGKERVGSVGHKATERVRRSLLSNV